jgi:hypothetical protein
MWHVAHGLRVRGPFEGEDKDIASRGAAGFDEPPWQSAGSGHDP